MKTFFCVKIKLLFNLSPKEKSFECLVCSETQERARIKTENHFQQMILHPQKTQYVFSNEEKNYIRVITEAGPDDFRLIKADIISIKDSPICCFWGDNDSNLYVAKIKADFGRIKTKQYVAIGAPDFDEAYNVIKKAITDKKYFASELLPKKYLSTHADYTVKDLQYYIDYIKRSNLSFIV